MHHRINCDNRTHAPKYEEPLRTVEINLPPSLLANARKLRKTMTDAEELLWQLLRNRQLNSYKSGDSTRFQRALYLISIVP